ncbi:hypothetical protein CEUSTIGMA_g12219.t1 [Chlamydomonas eustigma]|uniref:Uncharacterized protein n=1 Tax=Chlamydomonas eustigma TaxID=1157962 RepID=A0A250XP19_9CHLO|nr:hypothetical protein CEUSTIGMA_g12219.t1 [Chlamydomonas eustigma]|eukprot:GAX84798.1 hypothetical protein CEUSTIGMA_g12219.t1 [Chlamydomonas eustigma]
MGCEVLATEVLEEEAVLRREGDGVGDEVVVLLLLGKVEKNLTGCRGSRGVTRGVLLGGGIVINGEGGEGVCGREGCGGEGCGGKKGIGGSGGVGEGFGKDGGEGEGGLGQGVKGGEGGLG